MNKRERKMDAETLQQFLAFRKRANRVPAKKGKGSYDRKSFKKGVAQKWEQQFVGLLLTSVPFSTLYVE